MNFKNKTLFLGDNLEIMRGINSSSIDLIYFDPPFGLKSSITRSMNLDTGFEILWSSSDISASDNGELADRAPGLYDILRLSKQTHSKELYNYLVFLSIRLLETYRILKKTGSIYVHCDSLSSHYLKLAMDNIYNSRYYQAEIVWSHKSTGLSLLHWSKNHDLLLHYSKSDNFTHNVLTNPDTSSPIRDIWEDVSTHPKDRINTPGKRPLPLLDRIIRASSNESDIFLDPFCGYGTGLIVADNLSRLWAGIDINPKSLDSLNLQLSDQLFNPLTIEDHAPIRTDMGSTLTPRTKKHELYGHQQGTCIHCNLYFQFTDMYISTINIEQLLCIHCYSKELS